MPYKDIMSQWKKKVDVELNEFLSTAVMESEHVSIHAKDMMQEINELMMRGGKRIRPIFMIMGYLGCGGKDEKAILRACMAPELLHLGLLVQDDVMDNGDTRHGGKCIHKVYETLSQKSTKKYGENMALCGSDYLFALSMHAITSSNFRPDLKVQAVERLSYIFFNTATGQILDIEHGNEEIEKVGEDDITDIHILKTAKYSFEGPLQMGAILAGANDQMLFRLSEFAIPLGQAFQIQDDILGIFGDQKALGKPVDSDVKEGKKTLLVVKAYEKSTDVEKKRISLLLGASDLSHEDFQWIQKHIRNTGALEYSQNLARNLVDRARRKLALCTVNDEVRDFLDGVASYMIEREF